MQPQKRHAPDPACRQCHGTGRTRYATWHEDDTWSQGEETDCWCTTTPQHPDPGCAHCHGMGEIERPTYSAWTPTFIRAPCRCMQKRSQLAPFPGRPDSGDGLPDPDRLDYARNDYP